MHTELSWVSNRKDPTWLRGLVVFSFSIATASAILSSYGAYWSGVINFGLSSVIIPVPGSTYAFVPVICPPIDTNTHRSCSTVFGTCECSSTHQAFRDRSNSFQLVFQLEVILFPNSRLPRPVQVPCVTCEGLSSNMNSCS